MRCYVYIFGLYIYLNISFFKEALKIITPLFIMFSLFIYTKIWTMCAILCVFLRFLLL
jgi:hypothetical protein